MILIRILSRVPWLSRCSKILVRTCQDSQDGSKSVNPGTQYFEGTKKILIRKHPLSAVSMQIYLDGIKQSITLQLVLHFYSSKWTKNEHPIWKLLQFSACTLTLPATFILIF